MSQSSLHLTLIFRAELPNGPDPYVEELKSLDIPSVVLPVMQCQYRNTEVLQNSLKDPKSYSGIIFTSTRSVKAVELAVKDLPDDCLGEWRKKLNFSVGETTKNAAKCVLDFDTQGESAGNSENLGEIIVEKCPTSDKAFLFPCSSIRKDTIINFLESKGLGVKEICCYDISVHPELKKSWESFVSLLGPPEILVFFSPSGVQHVVAMLDSIKCELSNFKVVAIGPSTGEELCKIGCEPSAIASKPTPRDLCAAVKSIIQK